MRTYEFRLYPTRVQQQCLMACLRESRALYNEMLERQKQHYDETQRFLSKYDMTALFKGRGSEHVPATTVQTLADRLEKALRLFFAHRKEGWGFPRWKSANQWHSIHLRQWGVSRDAWLEARHLRVPKKLGTAIKIKRHREIEGTPKTCHLVLRADGHWYALVVCEVEQSRQAPAAQPETAVGIDVGLKVFLADSEGGTVENPRCYRNTQAALRRKQRRLSARKKGSKRRRKMARSVAHTHLTIARQRRDFHFKTAKRYVWGYRIIYVEDLNMRALSRSMLAKSVLDAGWGAFLDILADKAERAGGKVVRINPRFTTQNCSRCGELVQKSLSVRTHSCPHCGYVADRDVNAAQNILKAGAPPSGTVADGRPGEPRSLPL